MCTFTPAPPGTLKGLEIWRATLVTSTTETLQYPLQRSPALGSHSLASPAQPCKLLAVCARSLKLP